MKILGLFSLDNNLTFLIFKSKLYQPETVKNWEKNISLKAAKMLLKKNVSLVVIFFLSK